MKGQWMALRICPPWGEILINRATMPRSLATNTSLGYHPKPLYVPQTTRESFTVLAVSHWVDKANGPAAPPLQQRWELMLYAAVSNDRSWNVLGKWWKSLATLWENHVRSHVLKGNYVTVQSRVKPNDYYQDYSVLCSSHSEMPKL